MGCFADFPPPFTSVLHERLRLALREIIESDSFARALNPNPRPRGCLLLVGLRSRPFFFYYNPPDR